MILILSEKFDGPTEKVVSELKNLNANFKVIYGSDFLDTPFSIDIKNNIISFDNVKFDKINITWYRRWINSSFQFSENPKENNYLKREFEEMSSNFMLNLFTKKWLNIPPYIKAYPSKAHQLKHAKEIGLKIPNTIITNNKSELNFFFNKNNKNIISKNLSNPYFFNENNEEYATYTTLVQQIDIINQSKLFYPSLFQNNVSKIIEIRIFYILKKFYSYAIFSSNNKQTNIDFRIYDYTHPNKIMKYILPKEIENKLISFMEYFDLHTGSIDMIKDENNNFIFLEVNPQGQFGGRSEYGLYIEEFIANYLIENDI